MSSGTSSGVLPRFFLILGAEVITYFSNTKNIWILVLPVCFRIFPQLGFALGVLTYSVQRIGVVCSVSPWSSSARDLRSGLPSLKMNWVCRREARGGSMRQKSSFGSGRLAEVVYFFSSPAASFPLAFLKKIVFACGELSFSFPLAFPGRLAEIVYFFFFACGELSFSFPFAFL